MQVNITFRNMFATDALRNHVHDKLAKVVDKYLDKVTEAHVTLSLERYLHQADINLHAGHFHVRGKDKSEDMYASIDIASEAVKNQIKQIVSGEPGDKPYSDQKIVEVLRSQNVDIARRTVAKYREVLGILPSSKRKRFF